MRRLGLIAFLLLAPLPSAYADECLTEIQGLFSGPMDPFQRPPYRSTRIQMNAAGETIATFHYIIQSPIRTISYVEGGTAALIIETSTWDGPNLDGPWTPSSNVHREDRPATIVRGEAEKLKNLSDTQCLGIVSINGADLMHYHFKTKTDPDPSYGGLWFGSTDDIYVDPETNRIMRWEKTDFASYFAPAASNERSVEDFEYDETIEVNPPE